MIEKVRKQLAPQGALRAGINMANFLLVNGQNEAGSPLGVSPDMAQLIASDLNVDIEYIPYDSPADVADAAALKEWDIANIGAEPERAKSISFTDAYCEIEATYLIPENSAITSLDMVDQPGNRIAVFTRSAYGLWLCDNIKHAELIATSSMDESFEVFADQKLDALAGIRPRLLQDQQSLARSTILAGKFSSVQQAIGTHPENTAAAEYLRDFVINARTNGTVENLIKKHGMAGKLSVGQ